MKKMLFVLVALLIASPAMAGVGISASADVDGNTAVITISYDADGAAVRAVAIDITLDGDANVVDVNCVNGDFTIYPGSINIAGNGDVSDAGSCLCDDSYAGTLGGLDTNGVTLEMGSLYVGAGNEPADTGVLAEITIQGCGSVDVSIVENAIRGGVVLEDPDADPGTAATGVSGVDLGQSLCAPDPSCWDVAECPGQTLGDGNCSGGVNLGDLFALKAAFGVNAPWTTVACCSDYNQSGGVNLGDLFVLKANFGATVGASSGNQDCPAP